MQFLFYCFHHKVTEDALLVNRLFLINATAYTFLGLSSNQCFLSSWTSSKDLWPQMSSLRNWTYLILYLFVLFSAIWFIVHCCQGIFFNCHLLACIYVLVYHWYNAYIYKKNLDQMRLSIISL